MNLASVPPQCPLLDLAARHWLAQAGPDPLQVARGLILLPTHRAVRAMREAFLRVTDGTPLLLPRLAVLGGLDEDGLALHGALDLPPAVPAAQRLSVLTRMILAMGGANGAPQTADRAWLLAAELARLLDEATRSEIDLATRLPEAAEAGFAEHWQRTVDFLSIVTAAWPAWLQEQGLMDDAARQVALLNAQARAWQDAPPGWPVLAVAPSAAIPAVSRLLRVVAGLPQGLVLLPGLDCALDDAAWTALEPGHPQAGLRSLLGAMGASRGDVREWSGAGSASGLPLAADSRHAGTGRVDLLRRALLPAVSLQDWRDTAPALHPGLLRLEPDDQQDEAVAIALVLREALAAPHEPDGEAGRIALVTPDRGLAVRVSAELLRFGVVVDDSAGEALAETPPAAFLRLLATACVANLAPVPLLALLKHPLTACGMDPAACRNAARHLELAALRGPRPAGGLAGLRDAAGGRSAMLDGLLAELEEILSPLLALTGAALVPAQDLLPTLLKAAEELARSNTEAGAIRLWAQEDGNALAAALADALDALPGLPPQRPDILPGLLEALLNGQAVRSRRALRGRTDQAEHARIHIWGVREAQLQNVDVVVLGGMAETVWPTAPDPGPWLSRPMRTAIGLPAPEQRVGEMAHDFVMISCAARVAVLSCPRRRDGAPAVPSRWLTRLDALLAGHGLALPRHPASLWAAALDRPAGRPDPVSPPAPRPAVDRRPRRLSVTEVETWLRDPYAIYARHVLRLRALPGLDEPADASDYGKVVHQGIAEFLADAGSAWPADARARLVAAMDRALDQAALRPALTAWWRPRLARIADWVTDEEIRRRSAAPPAAIATEIDGEWQVSCPAGPFTVKGRADRVERHEAGLAILDYKTGVLPAQTEVEAGLAPQLPLEAVMADAGAFGPEWQRTATELTYWHLSGGFVPGEARSLFKGDAARVQQAMDTARDKLCALMRDFDNPDQAYLSQPHPGAAPRFSDYAQLSRVAEWALGEE